jgi:hypothetical protein
MVCKYGYAICTRHVCSCNILHMTKTDKFITKELHKVIKKCIVEKIEAYIKIQNLENTFLNTQQMFAQLAAYLVLSIPFYHTSRVFKFINTLSLNKCAFALKKQSILDQLEGESTNTMCSSIIDKYLDWPKDLDSLSLTKFVSYYNMRNKRLIKCLKLQIIHCVNYNKYKEPQKWSKEQLLYFSPFRNLEASQFGVNITWQNAFNEKKP